MINFLCGIPGGGKSYEACVFHILPTLERGRKVITNLPVNLEAFAAIDPSYRELLEYRPNTLAKKPVEAEAGDDGSFAGAVAAAKASRFKDIVFANVEDFQTDWRHPEGFGPLFVIDECHFAFPKADTSRAVLEWFSMHRHTNADVLLLSQTYRKVHVDIVDLVQMMYRVRKNIALGSTSSYTRVVQDGARGEVVSRTIRKYQPRYFKLYRSHTLGQAVDEHNATDVRPIWKHWSFIAAGAIFAAIAVMVGSGKVSLNLLALPAQAAKSPAPAASAVHRFSHLTPPPTPASAPASALAALPAASSASAATSVTFKAVTSAADPFSRHGLHLTGMLGSGARAVVIFTASLNGARLFTMTDKDLALAGYSYKQLGYCAGLLTWEDVRRVVTCDIPQQGVTAPSNSAQGLSTSVTNQQAAPAQAPVTASAIKG